MNINAKQVQSIDSQNKMDLTTVLGFFMQIRDKFTTETTLTTAMGQVWTAYTAAYDAFDDAFAQAKKWAQTADLEDLDKLRDAALSAFLNALKAMMASPNANKAAAAKTLTFIRDKYTISGSDEYMKETTIISQMVQEMETTAAAQLTATGLDDWLLDLKQKNEAFLAKMNERTEAQAGQQKGIVREKRLLCEAAYRNVVKLINAMAICEVPAGYSFGTIIDLVNAEIEHYRQILARKGGGSGSSSSGSSSGGSSSGSSSSGSSNSGNSGGTTDSGNTGTTEPGGSGTGTGSITPTDNTGGDDNQGGGTGTDTPENPGDNSGGGTGSITPTNPGDDNGGGDDSGGGDNPGGGGGIDMN